MSHPFAVVVSLEQVMYFGCYESSMKTSSNHLGGSGEVYSYFRKRAGFFSYNFLQICGMNCHSNYFRG